MSLESKLGQQMYELLPEVFRTRDNTDYDANGNVLKLGDTAAFLDVHGIFLDKIKATLQQRLVDSFPDVPLDGGPVCQDWLLPYFADLLDVRLVSPDAEGQRQEIANAIAWRKGKGTLRVIEHITEAISGKEAVLQEGWRRVASTPRIGMPMRPDAASGVNLDVSPAGKQVAAIGSRYPGLPAMMADLRWSARALQAPTGDPLVKSSRFGEMATTQWLHANPHAVSCFSGSYEDISRRCVDFRTPDWRRGHIHPGRVLIYLPPYAGFFTAGIKGVNWSKDEIENQSAAFKKRIRIYKDQKGVTVFRNKSLDSGAFVPVRIRGMIELGKDHEGDADADTWRFEGVILENSVIVHGGRLELAQCAARKVVLHSVDLQRPLLTATDSLFKTIENPRALSRLEYCTVLQRTVSEAIVASDCIFIGYIQKDRPSLAPPAAGCIRFSSVHAKQAGGGAQIFRASISRDEVRMFSMKFGDPGCGVLHPETRDAICFGAEDGGEMGTYHHRHYCLRWKAVIDKLGDYMPIGIEPVLIPDERLGCTPPENSLST
ncbi:MAG: phage tail protein [Mariprofundaceae bacterium]